MRKLLIILFFITSSNSFALDKEMLFTKEVFNSAQKAGKTVVINSWNKFCFTCIKQEKVIKEAKKDFNNVIFLTYEQKNKDIANYLNIDYRSTIVVYKNNKEIARAIGVTKKEEIYSLIRKGS
tara:strand:- start:287 stop:655 length:369 start_codon:yes stop_codon:yes gene_type:complete